VVSLIGRIQTDQNEREWHTVPAEKSGHGGLIRKGFPLFVFGLIRRYPPFPLFSVSPGR
jgi:hypothetical protein